MSFERADRAGARRSSCCPPRSATARRTRTSSTVRPASASNSRRSAFAGELLGQPERVERRAHPDLYVLEPHGDQIRIDDVRELRRDLHMRPFEADRRVYLIFDAHLLNADAADALLKDLEEPPPYAVVVLVADELGPLPETIRSRCQLVPFRRLSERADARGGRAARARPLAGRADRGRARRGRAARPGRASARPGGRPPRGRSCSRSHARSTPIRLRPDRGGAGRAGARGRARGRRRRPLPRRRSRRSSLPDREGEQHVKRAERGAEREEILLALEELASWYRDLVVVAAARSARSSTTTTSPSWPRTATAERMPGAERAAEVVRGSWRTFEEFNVAPQLALEAMFVRVRRELRRRAGARLSSFD